MNVLELLTTQCKSIWNQKKYLFLLGTIMFLGFYIHHNQLQFVGDAGDYWNSAMLYERTGAFAFENYDIAIRGYVFPFILYIIQKIGSIIPVEHGAIYVDWLSFSIFYSYSFTILIPDFYNKLFDKEIKRRGLFTIIFLFIIMYFFRGLIVYTLTDIPALLFFLIALNLLLNVLKTKLTKKSLVLHHFGIGVFLGICYYFRPAYSLAIVCVYLFYFVFLIKERKINLKKWMLGIICFPLGLILIAFPQVKINKVNFDTTSPMIQTQKFYTDGNLAFKQLYWGIQMQKYETNINLDVYPTYQVYFKDPVGYALLSKEGIESFTSYSQYFEFILKNPIDVGMIYLKHIFNGFDITYNEAYINNLYKDRFPIQILNYSLIFMAGFYVIRHRNKLKKLKLENVLMIGILFSTIVLSIPSAIEPRFFIPIQVMVFYYSAYAISTLDEYFTKKELWKVAGYYTLFVILCFLLNKSTFDLIGLTL